MLRNMQIVLFLFILVIFMLNPSPLFPSNQEQDNIIEKVTVTNVEIPVRVLLKGKPVTNLTREDFTLYENNKPVTINGFFLKKKRINSPAFTSGENTINEYYKAPLLQSPRNFVLVFSITDFNEYLKKAIEHLFTNILKKGDRLLVIANDRTHEYLQLKDIGIAKEEILTILKSECHAARNRLTKYINQVEMYLNLSDFRKNVDRIDQRPEKLVNFLEKYLLTWNEYKNRYLTPRIDRFYYFAKYLERLKGEKWVLNFYQLDLFPNIRFGTETMDAIRDISTALMESGSAASAATGKMINNYLNQIIIALNVAAKFPTEDVAKLFYKVDATFHSFLIRGLNKIGREDLEFQEVASDIEKTLKDITKITGGETIASNDLVKSLTTVADLEDAYYILTYVPVDPAQKTKIKITVNNKNYKVLYDNNFREDYIEDFIKEMEKNVKVPEIKIQGFSFENKNLTFVISDYFMKGVDESVEGNIKVRIRIIERENNVRYDQEKSLVAKKNTFKISLPPFVNLKGGDYNIIIDAVDILSGKDASLHEAIRIK